MTGSEGSTFVALSGGVGGAKLALGLANVLKAGSLTIVANTGDDFEHLGLSISPDLDSIMYTLAGLANPDTGWGRAEETWQFLKTLAELGGDSWFRLGDKDLAVHVLRTHLRASGASLSEATARLCRALHVDAQLVPMSDEPVRTFVLTTEGELSFQDYFVRKRCEPRVTGFRYEGAARAKPSAAVLDALRAPTLAGVIVCPSNPFVSIGPILAVPGMEEALRARRVPVVAVSPIVGGAAVKGPAAKMMMELRLPATALEVARGYATRGIVDGFIFDSVDAHVSDEVSRLGLRARSTKTVMHSLDDRVDLAREAIDFALTMREGRMTRN
jgi:LPPG:FO 2-phospho-L-lactate transferase